MYNATLYNIVFFINRELMLCFVLSHLSIFRGLSMIRKNLQHPNDLKLMPSFLGSIFRVAIDGVDTFDYETLVVRSTVSSTVSSTASSITNNNPSSSANNADLEQQKRLLHAWNTCRNHLGMQTDPGDRGPYLSYHMRQQYQPVP